ncbi:cytosine-specific DNA methylase domain-containing protein [Phaeobacter inhibens]|uniref:DNA (cytosine-5-)-methyltransferase n=1 Tax=Phaeobacter inhibens TaxID=221822 RepID=A0ABM6RDM5_9RHOB|nr:MULTISPECIES: DNA cytosine methyltransferase [Phaeobacter]ATF17110.1 cytosine-specific DNA methylase domain-containing protein [Phaeobacter gallaeciensis]ATF21219.1 cytosine-specific DNA methylase domain-containing protein [Phaeobacter gallaeciensis]AUQ94467.1 cytosine-specific DNA methylase domain-containing protein [Phaeobacter inhibens]
MIGMTMCSGIGAPELAAPWVDWRFASDIEDFPRAVLADRFGYRLPEDHNQGDPLLWGDMTEITPDLLRDRGVPLPDLVVAGTPCQAFSVAGLRKGTDDDRGNLTLKFVEILHDLVAARPDGKLAVVWENVPGVLSDKGNAFGCFLGGLVGSVDPLLPGVRPKRGKSTGLWKWHAGGKIDILDDDGEPTGETEVAAPHHRPKWPSEGMVQGPRARAAWSVLDAQWCGVAQRRRRVFVVIDFGDCIDPAAVLLEPDRLRGDSPPRRETGQGSPEGAQAGFGGGGGQVYTRDVAHCLETTCDDYSRADGFNMVAHALRGEGFDASEDGTGRGTQIVPVSGFSSSGDGYWRSGVGPLRAREQDSHENIVAFDCKGTEVQFTEDDCHPTLRSMGHSNSHQNAGGHAAVAFDMRGRDGGAMPEGPHQTANIRAASGGSSRSYVALPWAVRRLTPRECERLQGMPDDHTLIGNRKTRRKIEADELAYLRRTYPDLTDEDAKRLAADGPRYKAIGNSMAVPVMRWIINRTKDSYDQTRDSN